MQVVYERCAGLDVHKKSVTACLVTPGPGRQRRREIKTFGTTTPKLLEMLDWLTASACTHVAIESTGVYWKPVYHLLEGACQVLLVNARHVKAVPGRKTDISDAEWLADLLQHGLLKGSFIPPQPIRDLRELTRYRKALTRERASEANRVQKLLEAANIKLASVASDVLGVSGRAMLEAMLSGEEDACFLAGLARGHLRKKIPELEQALVGRVEEVHRFVLAQQLAHIDYLDGAIEQCGAEIERRMLPFNEEVERLDTIPGVNQVIAQVMVAEIGVDMARFPSSRHLASWAGMCPGNDESAGKRKSGKTRKGSTWLREALVEAAWGATRSKNTYLSALYHRLAPRRGKKKALVAVGHTILVIAYHLLSRQQRYVDLGANYLDERQRLGTQNRLVRRLQALGYQVTLQPAPATAS